MTTTEKVILTTGIVLIVSTAAWGGHAIIKKLTNGNLNPQVKPDDNSPQFIFGSNPDKFSPEIINAAERIYRIESANFTSNIYKNTYGAGMIATTSTNPYGWDSLATLWASGSNKPIGTATYGQLQYIKFSTLRAGAYALCVKLNDYENTHNKADYWNNGATGSATYLASLNAISPSACFSKTIPGNPLL